MTHSAEGDGRATDAAVHGAGIFKHVCPSPNCQPRSKAQLLSTLREATDELLTRQFTALSEMLRYPKTSVHRCTRSNA